MIEYVCLEYVRVYCSYGHCLCRVLSLGGGGGRGEGGGGKGGIHPFRLAVIKYSRVSVKQI